MLIKTLYAIEVEVNNLDYKWIIPVYVDEFGDNVWSIFSDINEAKEQLAKVICPKKRIVKFVRAK
jgi:hypothetical protein